MSEVHLFLLWSNARPHEREIVDDISDRFRLLETVEVTWSTAQFPRNLTCFYGTDLPPGSEKELDSGTGPFLVCVVEDANPRHRFRRAGRRVLRENRRMIDARTRYRAMVGGSYRVHASVDRHESERDLVLLFGSRPRAFLNHTRADAESPRAYQRDVLGADGWRDLDELLLALEVTAGVRRVGMRDGVDLFVLVRSRWWAEQILNGQEVGPGVWRVDVAGEPRTIAVAER